MSKPSARHADRTQVWLVARTRSRGVDEEGDKPPWTSSPPVPMVGKTTSKWPYGSIRWVHVPGHGRQGWNTRKLRTWTRARSNGTQPRRMAWRHPATSKHDRQACPVLTGQRLPTIDGKPGDNLLDLDTHGPLHQQPRKENLTMAFGKIGRLRGDRDTGPRGTRGNRRAEGRKRAQGQPGGGSASCSPRVLPPAAAWPRRDVRGQNHVRCVRVVARLMAYAASGI